MQKKIFFIASLVLILGINLYFRSFPINFPQLKTQAKDIIEKSIQQMAAQEVHQKFPQFYPTAKDEIARTRIAEYKRQNKKIIKSQIWDLYRQLKNRYQDDSGQTYLMELDCWHWARYVENVLRHGRPGDEVIAGRQWDYFMLAPLGFFLHWEHFLYYLSAFFYNLFSIFKPVPLFYFLFYLPLLFITIFLGVLYFFSFWHGKYIAGITTCLFVGLAPMFLPRSCAGWFDTDILNLLFPLLVAWTYILSSSSSSVKHRLFWICLSGFWVGLFCFTWTQWWFIFLFIIIYELIFLICLGFGYFYLKKENLNLLKQHFLSLFLFSFFSLFWIIILAGSEPLATLYNHLKQALSLNRPLSASIWPNVYFTVGELKRASIFEMGRSIGGMWLFVSSAICLLVILIRALFYRTYPDFKRSSIIIIAIWFVSMVFASSRGVRFIVFLLIPLGLSLGWLMNDIYDYFRKKRNIIGMLIVVMIFAALNTVFIDRGYSAAKSIFPLMDDTWYKVLNLIKEKTSQETIVNSWWDFGDWFKAAARRRVIFDGQSQHTPMAYWMAKALLSDNEDEAVNILRMLNNAGNKTFEIIDEHLKDPLLSVLLLESVLSLPAERGKEVLQKFLPASLVENVNKILSYNPARANFVVDHTMPHKMSAISYLGNWDFSKVYIAQNFDKTERDKIIEHLKNLGRDEQETQRFYQEVFLISTKKLDDWLSRRLQFYSPLFSGREKDGIIFFEHGFTYNPKERTIQSNSNQIPRSLFLATEDSLTETVYPNANSIFSILIYKTNEGYKSILLDPELGRSMFVRLYFLNGIGLKHFSSFIDVEEGNNYIRVFNIVW